MESREADQRLLTRAEVAAIFQVSPSTITRWAEAGKLPVVKTLGGHRRYNAVVVESLARQFSPQFVSNNETISLNEEATVTKTVIDVPAMYGDHHVLEVRQILLALPGVQTVHASSAFKAVEIEFDPAQIGPKQLAAPLAEAGYLEPLPLPTEADIAVTLLSDDERSAAFRHTTAFEQAKDVVSFAHAVPPKLAQRPLWPCPGIGVLRTNGPRKEMDHG
jgi:excisionase family DNA binding protein